MAKTVLPISVVIPCYNCASTIRRAVFSIFEQAAIPLETILVDDCSQDGTLAVLQELARTYQRLKIIQMERNLGAASARNVGWSASTQPYIAFLDADDSWHPEKLHIQYGYMKNNCLVALCGHQCTWLRDYEMPPQLLISHQVVRISGKSLLFKNAFNTPTVMLKRDIPFRFHEGRRYAEDLLLWQQIAFAGLQVVRIEKPLAYVHKSLYGAGGLSAQLWKMEIGELSNFVFLYRSGSISFAVYFVSSFFSIVKFIKRVFLTLFL